MKSWIVGATTTAPSTSAANHNALGGNDGVWRANADDRNLTLWPLASIAIDQFMVRVAVAPGVGKSYTFAIYADGVATGITCTISDAAVTASDLTNTYTPTAGQQLTIRSSPSGTPAGTGRVMWNARVNGGANQSLMMAHSPNNDSAAAARDYPPMGSGQVTSAGGLVMPCAGTFKNMYIVSPDPGGVASRKFTLNVNGVASALTATATAGVTAINDTTHTVSVVKGDYVWIEDLPIASAVAGRPGFGIEFDPTVDGQSVLGGSSIDDYATGSLYQVHGPDIGDATESNRILHMPACTLSNEYFEFALVPGVGNSRTLQSRFGAANGNLVVTVSGLALSGEDATHTDVLTSGSLFSWLITESGAPTAADVLWSVVMTETATATTTWPGYIGGGYF